MIAKKSRLVSKNDWAEYWEKNKILIKKMKEKGKTYIDLSDIEFKNSLVDLNKDQLKKMLPSMKSTRDFYKKIIQEPYYIEHPEKKETPRYINAAKYYNSVNSKGKIINQLIHV